MSDDGLWQQIAQIEYATIQKVQTLASAGGFRTTVDGTSQEIAQAAYLMPFADAPGVTLRVTFERWVPGRQEKQEDERVDSYGL